MFSKKNLTFEEGLARTKKTKEIKGIIGGILFLILMAYISITYMAPGLFGGGVPSCPGKYVSGDYGEGKEGVQRFKSDCGSLSKDKALEEITRISDNVSPSETIRLRTDILTYW